MSPIAMTTEKRRGVGETMPWNIRLQRETVDELAKYGEASARTSQDIMRRLLDWFLSLDLKDREKVMHMESPWE